MRIPAARRFQASLGPSAHLLAVATQFLNDLGISKIFDHVINLTDLIIEFVNDHSSFELNSPVENIDNRSGIINCKCPQAEDIVMKLRKPKKRKFRKSEKPIAISVREGGIRISPHCYNTEEEILTCMETIYDLSKQ